MFTQEKTKSHEQFNRLRSMMETVKEKYGVKSLTDIDKIPPSEVDEQTRPLLEVWQAVPREVLGDIERWLLSEESPEFVARHAINAFIAGIFMKGYQESAKDGYLSVRIPPDISKRLDALVESRQIESKSALIRNLLEFFLGVAEISETGEAFAVSVTELMAATFKDPGTLLFYSIFSSFMHMPESRELLKIMYSVRAPLAQILSAFSRKPVEATTPIVDKTIRAQEAAVGKRECAAKTGTGGTVVGADEYETGV